MMEKWGRRVSRRSSIVRSAPDPRGTILLTPTKWSETILSEVWHDSRAFFNNLCEVSPLVLTNEVLYIPGKPELNTVLYLDEIFKIFAKAPDKCWVHFPAHGLGVILYRYTPEVLALIVCRRGLKTTPPQKVRQGHRAFPKMFTNVVELFKNCPAKLSNIPEKAHQHYRTFRKLSVKVTGLSGKKEGPKHTFPRLLIQGTLPDFPKKPGKVVGLS
jgi:hypothetical protein